MRGANFVRSERSRKLRSLSTRAEMLLWARLRSRGLADQKFVRQGPIGPYTVDFICRTQRLIIEVDGGQHAGSAADAVRDRWLRQHGYHVLRFWNHDVLDNIEGVLAAISSALQPETPPHPISACGENRPLPASGER